MRCHSVIAGIVLLSALVNSFGQSAPPGGEPPAPIALSSRNPVPNHRSPLGQCRSGAIGRPVQFFSSLGRML
jgi:hypothetical protein